MKKLSCAIALILIAACSKPKPLAPPAPQSMNGLNPCTVSHGIGKNGPNGAPFVCINYETFSARTQPNPEHLHAWHTAPVHFWFYNVGNAKPQLALHFKEPETTSRIMPPECNGPHCKVNVRTDASPDTEKRTYKIVDTVTGNHLDPDILIEP